MKKLMMLALLGTAGCGSDPVPSMTNVATTRAQPATTTSGGARTPAQASAAAANQARLEPGEWRIETRLRDVTSQGLPPEVAQRMRESASTVSSESQCLTPEQAARPPADLFAGGKRGSCTYETFDIKDGRLTATLSCPDRSGAKMAMSMDGSFSKTAYTVDSTMRIQSPTPGQELRITMQSKGERVGPCRTGR